MGLLLRLSHYINNKIIIKIKNNIKLNSDGIYNNCTIFSV